MNDNQQDNVTLTRADYKNLKDSLIRASIGLKHLIAISPESPCTELYKQWQREAESAAHDVRIRY